MWAMAGQESGWDYYARNASSGAFGKYQIMPFNWPVWADEYLGDASRRPDALEPGEGGLREAPRPLRLAGLLEARRLLVAHGQHRAAARSAGRATPGATSTTSCSCAGRHRLARAGCRFGRALGRSAATGGVRRSTSGCASSPGGKPWRRGGLVSATARSCGCIGRPRPGGRHPLDRGRDAGRTARLAATGAHAAGGASLARACLARHPRSRRGLPRHRIGASCVRGRAERRASRVSAIRPRGSR